MKVIRSLEVGTTFKDKWGRYMVVNVLGKYIEYMNMINNCNAYISSNDADYLVRCGRWQILNEGKPA